MSRKSITYSIINTSVIYAAMRRLEITGELTYPSDLRMVASLLKAKAFILGPGAITDLYDSAKAYMN